jgi:hypothetical protein
MSKGVGDSTPFDADERQRPLERRQSTLGRRIVYQ